MIELRKETNAKYKLKVGRSATGFGLFAMEPIPSGVKIIEYVGKFMIDEPDESKQSRYIYNLNKHMDVDGSPRWNTARYANHSCRGNAESDVIKGRVWIKSIKNIMLGDEITYDYGKEYFDEFIKPHGCRCAKCVAKNKKSTEVKSKKR